MPGISDALSFEKNGVVIAIEVTAGGKKDAFPCPVTMMAEMDGVPRLRPGA